jgi:cytochrome c biogenesis protein CcmG, thiol:disulfide interchange protein DsbE
MSMIRPQVLSRALLILLVGAFLFAVLWSGSAAPIIGQTAPDFRLPDLNGNPVQLSDYRGQVVVLNFWATWCPPCIEEMPSLVRFQEEFAASGVVVMAVSVDDDEQALRRFVAEHNLNFVVARDAGRRVAATYHTFKYPETFILDRQGRLVQKVIGPADWNESSIRSFFRELAARG